MAACCFFPTDIHDEKLGSPGPSDSLIRAQEIKGELLMILGVNDTHVVSLPPELIVIKDCLSVSTTLVADV